MDAEDTEALSGLVDLYYEEQELRQKCKLSYTYMSDEQVLSMAVKWGEGMNNVTIHFPAYDVAKKLLDNNWKPTVKQRAAIENVMAFYASQRGGVMNSEVLEYE
jgi:hypothetical protein